jgi:hypothetical protein
MHINVVNEEDGTTSNTVSYLQGNEEVTLNGQFNHYIGTAYAITDRWRMTNEDKTTYTCQERKLYTSALSQTEDDDTFLFYSAYSANNSADSNLIGINTDGIVTGVAQKFDVTNAYNKRADIANISSQSGYTFVRIFKAEVISEESEDDEQTDTGAEEKGEDTSVTDADSEAGEDTSIAGTDTESGADASTTDTGTEDGADASVSDTDAENGEVPSVTDTDTEDEE